MKNKKIAAYVFKFALLSLVLVLGFILISSISKRFLDYKSSDTSLPVFDSSNKKTYVIDAGHGGEDAGASADDGTKEKDLNLKIATLLKALYVLNGNDVKMTRESDTLLYDYYGDLDDYTGQKKIYDLKNRVKITEEFEDPIFIGIHMNKFSQSQYCGTQVYYSKNDTSSAVLAKNIQSSVKTYLQPNNERQTKRADSSIYVLDNLECPAVLVECGFLSNSQETELLKNGEYQGKMALAIFVASFAHDTFDK
ncbi:MAG: N-acetylmuramoyl-L-alanine amidase [Clostridia bacterium]|nr:N-acetylmuramoyl-L-alanine amidase [Clostridia bacterium]